jgi:hypothetical protein
MQDSGRRFYCAIAPRFCVFLPPPEFEDDRRIKLSILPLLPGQQGVDFAAMHEFEIGPFVWTSRASQAESAEWQ